MPRLIHLAEYGHSRSGSFIPGLQRVLGDALTRGWSAEAVFSGSGGEPPPWLGDFERGGIGVRFVGAANRRGRARWIAALLEESNEPTILHTHFTTFDLAAVVAARRRPHAKVIWHEHTALNGGANVVFRNLVKFGVFGRGAEKILCPAPDLARSVRRRLGPRDRVLFLPNAIDADRYRPASASERARARHDLGLAPKVPVLLAFGWNWTVKGADIFIAALKRARLGNPDLCGLIVSDDPRAAQLRGDSSLEGVIRLLPAQDDVRPLFAAADIFVAPSRAEGGTPYGVLEAIAADLPVVASRIPGHTFICDGLESCQSVPVNVTATAAAIERMLSSPPSLRAREAGRARVVSDFELSTWSGRLIDIYTGILA
jgi:glycosyltransferase involved in cell wall biosynthesis